MRPSRMHHHAFVSRNLEATRRFYEEILGLPLVATWCEGGLEGDGSNPFCHTFFELEDGSCLAFFHFADPATTEAHARLASTSPFDHVAVAATSEVQSAVEERAKKAGLETRVIDHGYCRSLYVNDPDGLLLELTVDASWAVESAGHRRASARRDLDRWIAGDHTPNNDHRTTPH